MSGPLFLALLQALGDFGPRAAPAGSPPPAFTLQDEYCPVFQKPFIVLSDDGTASPSSVFGRIDIVIIGETTCGVRITEGVSAQFISLEDVS